MKAKRKKIERMYRLIWSSLESHLEYTYSKKLNSGETNAFHVKCVKEYSELMKLLGDLY